MNIEFGICSVLKELVLEEFTATPVSVVQPVIIKNNTDNTHLWKTEVTNFFAFDYNDLNTQGMIFNDLRSELEDCSVI